MFTKGFGYTYDGAPALECTVDGFTVRAWTERDDDGSAPDERQDGYWPSLDPKSDGYIGAKSPRTLARHMAKARAVMAAWKAGEWDFCGVCVSVTLEGVELCDGYEAAVWDCERNHPNDNENVHLLYVANERIPEALQIARERLAKLCAKAA